MYHRFSTRSVDGVHKHASQFQDSVFKLKLPGETVTVVGTVELDLNGTDVFTFTLA